MTLYFRSIVFAVTLVFGSTAVHGQSWQLNEWPGTVLVANVGLEGSRIRPFGLACEEPGVAARPDPGNFGLGPIAGLDIFVVAGAFPGLEGGRHPFPGAEPPSTGVPVSVLVDGELLLASGMNYNLVSSDVYERIAPNHPLVKALKRGSKATVRIGDGHELTLSLRGSAQAIDTLLARCRLN